MILDSTVLGEAPAFYQHARWRSVPAGHGPVLGESDRRNHIRSSGADRSSDLAAASYFRLTNSGRLNLSNSAYFFPLLGRRKFLSDVGFLWIWGLTSILDNLVGSRRGLVKACMCE
jgi:hypothetical protein